MNGTAASMERPGVAALASEAVMSISLIKARGVEINMFEARRGHGTSKLKFDITSGNVDATIGS